MRFDQLSVRTPNKWRKSQSGNELCALHNIDGGSAQGWKSCAGIAKAEDSRRGYLKQRPRIQSKATDPVYSWGEVAVGSARMAENRRMPMPGSHQEREQLSIVSVA